MSSSLNHSQVLERDLVDDLLKGMLYVGDETAKKWPVQLGDSYPADSEVRKTIGKPFSLWRGNNQQKWTREVYCGLIRTIINIGAVV